MAGRFPGVRAVVFDLDGVLIDTETINVEAAFRAFEALGCRLETADAAEIVGRHPDDYVPRLARRFGLGRADLDRLREVQDRLYLRRWREEARLADGAERVLALVRERGLRTALATSGGRSHVRDCLERFGLARSFDVVLTKDDVERRKPDPEIYLRCAGSLAVDPRKMLVVEDSEHGIRAAKAAGAVCVAVRTPHTPESRISAADAVVDFLSDLPALLGFPETGPG